MLKTWRYSITIRLLVTHEQHSGKEEDITKQPTHWGHKPL